MACARQKRTFKKRGNAQHRAHPRNITGTCQTHPQTCSKKITSNITGAAFPSRFLRFGATACPSPNLPGSPGPASTSRWHRPTARGAPAHRAASPPAGWANEGRGTSAQNKGPRGHKHRILSLIVLYTSDLFLKMLVLWEGCRSLEWVFESEIRSLFFRL